MNKSSYLVRFTQPIRTKRICKLWLSLQRTTVLCTNGYLSFSPHAFLTTTLERKANGRVCFEHSSNITFKRSWLGFHHSSLFPAHYFVWDWWAGNKELIKQFWENLFEICSLASCQIYLLFTRTDWKSWLTFFKSRLWNWPLPVKRLPVGGHNTCNAKRLCWVF